MTTNFVHYEDRPLPPVLVGSHPDPTRRVRKVLGITTTMPKSYSGSFMVDGHKVAVFANGKTPFRTTKKGGHPTMVDHGKGRYMHRIFFVFGDGSMVAIGRIHQVLPPEPPPGTFPPCKCGHTERNWKPRACKACFHRNTSHCRRCGACSHVSDVTGEACRYCHGVRTVAGELFEQPAETEPTP